MIKKDTVVVLMGTVVVIGIITILSFFIVWICFPAVTPQDSFKDALDFSGGVFGGSATLGAAVIAAYLFNDWRDEKKFDLRLNKIEEILLNINTNVVKVSEFSYPLVSILDNPERQVLINSCINYKYYPSLEELTSLNSKIENYIKLFDDDSVLKIFELYISKLIHVRELLEDFYLAYDDYRNLLKTSPNGSDRVYILNDILSILNKKQFKTCQEKILEIIYKETDNKYPYEYNDVFEDKKSMLYHIEDFFEHAEGLKEHLRKKIHA